MTMTIDSVVAENMTGLGGLHFGLNDGVLVAGFSVQVHVVGGFASSVTEVVMPGGWSTTVFYSVSTSTFWFDLPPLNVGIGSGALVLLQGRTVLASTDIMMLTPETGYRTADLITYTHTAMGGGASEGSTRTGISPSAAEAAAVTTGGSGFGYSYDGTNYKIEEYARQLVVMSNRASPVIPSTPPTGLSYGQFKVQEEREQYPFGSTSDFAANALIGDPVVSMSASEIGFPTDRWSQYGVGFYMPTVADMPLASGAPDVTVVQPASWFTTGRRVAHDPGSNDSPGWSDDLEDLSNWDLISGSMSVGGGFGGGNGMHLTGAGSAARVKSSVRPGAFAAGLYRIDAWVGGTDDGNVLRVGMEFYDQAGALISTVWGDPYAITAADAVNSTWASGVAPAGTWTRGLILEFVSGTGDVWFDAVVYRVDSTAYPDVTATFNVPATHRVVDSIGNAYTLVYLVTDAQIALEGATHATENLRFSVNIGYLTASFQPVGWRYWLPAAFADTPTPPALSGSTLTTADLSRNAIFE